MVEGKYVVMKVSKTRMNKCEGYKNAMSKR